MTREEILDKGQKLFMKLADFLFENHKTLSDIIYPRVFYKVIDGKEYQLIKLEHLYECLENIGFCISDQDQTWIEHFCDVIFSDTAKVESISKFL